MNIHTGTEEEGGDERVQEGRKPEKRDKIKNEKVKKVLILKYFAADSALAPPFANMCRVPIDQGWAIQGFWAG